MVIRLDNGQVLLENYLLSPEPRAYAAEALKNIGKPRKSAIKTNVGTMYAHYDDELAYLMFVSDDYPPDKAATLVKQHVNSVKSLKAHGQVPPKDGNMAVYAALCRGIR